MKERGIIFSGDNPKLILEGRKTQTRRIVKRHFQGPHYTTVDPVTWHNPTFSSALGEVMFHYAAGGTSHSSGPGPLCIPCPYGVAGDRLWVRESFFVDHYDFCPRGRFPKERPDYILDEHIYYRVTDQGGIPEYNGKIPWRPSLHMPRWASRITLEITKVRVERLQDISHRDALAEGVQYDVSKPDGSPLARYRKLWDSLHGEGAWDKNPWVWVLEFRRLSAKESSTATVTTKKQ